MRSQRGVVGSNPIITTKKPLMNYQVKASNHIGAFLYCWRMASQILDILEKEVQSSV
ncbi:MAG: hypothetical protein V1897_01085 [Pseudomonadota bacterium]